MVVVVVVVVVVGLCCLNLGLLVLGFCRRLPDDVGFLLEVGLGLGEKATLLEALLKLLLVRLSWTSNRLSSMISTCIRAFLSIVINMLSISALEET